MSEAPKAESSDTDKAEQNKAAVRSSLFSASKLSLTMAITMPLGLVTKILVPRMLGSEQAGILFFAETFPLFVLGFMPMGISAYIQKHVPPRHEHAAEIFPTIAVFGGFVGVVLLGGMGVFLSFSTYDSLTVRIVVIMAICQALTIYGNEFLQRFFLAMGRYDYTSVINVVAKVTLVAFVGLCMLLGGGIQALALSFVGAQVLVLGLMLGKAKSLGLMQGRFSFDTLKTVLLVGLPFFLGGVVNTINPAIDSYCLTHLANFTELGYYGAAQRLTGLFLMLTPIISQAFGPSLSQVYARDRAAYSGFVLNIIRIVLLLGTPLALGFVAFAPEIIQILYGADFKPAVLAVVISGPMVLISYLATFLAISLATTSNGRSFPLILGLGTAVNFSLDYLLIRPGIALFGVGGGAAGATVASLVTMSVEVFFFLRLGGDSTLTKRALGYVGRGLLPLVALAFAATHWYQVHLAIRIAGFIVAVPLYLVVSRLLTKDDRSLLTRLRRRRA